MSNSSNSDEDPQPPTKPQPPTEGQLPSDTGPPSTAENLDEIFAGITPEPPSEGSRIMAEGEQKQFERAGEKQDYEVRQQVNFEVQKQIVELSGARQDIGERKSYASKLFVLLACWMCFVAICFLLTGCKELQFSFLNFPIATGGFFYLSDTVLIALLAGATVNLIALFAIVAWYLFPKK